MQSLFFRSIHDQCNQTDVIMHSAGPRGAAPLLVRSGVSGLQVMYVTDEKELFQELVTIMRRCVFGAKTEGTTKQQYKFFSFFFFFFLKACPVFIYTSETDRKQLLSNKRKHVSLPQVWPRHPGGVWGADALMGLPPSASCSARSGPLSAAVTSSRCDHLSPQECKYARYTVDTCADNKGSSSACPQVTPQRTTLLQTEMSTVLTPWQRSTLLDA